MNVDEENETMKEPETKEMVNTSKVKGIVNVMAQIMNMDFINLACICMKL